MSTPGKANATKSSGADSKKSKKSMGKTPSTQPEAQSIKGASKTASKDPAGSKESGKISGTVANSAKDSSGLKKSQYSDKPVADSGVSGVKSGKPTGTPANASITKRTNPSDKLPTDHAISNDPSNKVSRRPSKAKSDKGNSNNAISNASNNKVSEKPKKAKNDEENADIAMLNASSSKVSGKSSKAKNDEGNADNAMPDASKNQVSGQSSKVKNEEVKADGTDGTNKKPSEDGKPQVAPEAYQEPAKQVGTVETIPPTQSPKSKAQSPPMQRSPQRRAGVETSRNMLFVCVIIFVLLFILVTATLYFVYQFLTSTEAKISAAKAECDKLVDKFTFLSSFITVNFTYNYEFNTFRTKRIRFTADQKLDRHHYNGSGELYLDISITEGIYMIDFITTYYNNETLTGVAYYLAPLLRCIARVFKDRKTKKLNSTAVVGVVGQSYKLINLTGVPSHESEHFKLRNQLSSSEFDPLRNMTRLQYGWHIGQHINKLGDFSGSKCFVKYVD